MRVLTFTSFLFEVLVANFELVGFQKQEVHGFIMTLESFINGKSWPRNNQSQSSDLQQDYLATLYYLIILLVLSNITDLFISVYNAYTVYIFISFTQHIDTLCHWYEHYTVHVWHILLKLVNNLWSMWPWQYLDICS